MLIKGKAKRLTIYVDEGDRYQGKPIHEAIVHFLFKHKVSGVTLFRGIAGYGADGVFHSIKILRLHESLPIMIDIIEREEVLEKILPELEAMVTKGLIVTSEVDVIKCSQCSER